MSSKNRILGAKPEEAKAFKGYQPGSYYLLSPTMMKLSQSGVAQDITSRTSSQGVTHNVHLLAVLRAVAGVQCDVGCCEHDNGTLCSI
jgi:hypothetical protein